MYLPYINNWFAGFLNHQRCMVLHALAEDKVILLKIGDYWPPDLGDFTNHGTINHLRPSWDDPPSSLPKTNSKFAPEKKGRLPQKEKREHTKTIHFQVLLLSLSRGVALSKVCFVSCFLVKPLSPPIPTPASAAAAAASAACARADPTPATPVLLEEPRKAVGMHGHETMKSWWISKS